MGIEMYYEYNVFTHAIVRYNDRNTQINTIAEVDNLLKAAFPEGTALKIVGDSQRSPVFSIDYDYNGGAVQSAFVIQRNGVELGRVEQEVDDFSNYDWVFFDGDVMKVRLVCTLIISLGHKVERCSRYSAPFPEDNFFGVTMS